MFTASALRPRQSLTNGLRIRETKLERNSLFRETKSLGRVLDRIIHLIRDKSHFKNSRRAVGYGGEWNAISRIVNDRETNATLLTVKSPLVCRGDAQNDRQATNYGSGNEDSSSTVLCCSRNAATTVVARDFAGGKQRGRRDRARELCVRGGSPHDRCVCVSEGRGSVLCENKGIWGKFQKYRAVRVLQANAQIVVDG